MYLAGNVKKSYHWRSSLYECFNWNEAEFCFCQQSGQPGLRFGNSIRRNGTLIVWSKIEFFSTIRRQIWQIFDPSPPRACRRLKWIEWITLPSNVNSNSIFPTSSIMIDLIINLYETNISLRVSFLLPLELCWNNGAKVGLKSHLNFY